MDKRPHEKDIRLSRVTLRDDEIAEQIVRVEAVLRSGLFTNGPETRRFEAEFGAYLGVEHVVAVNSGTSALEIALRLCDVAGREVLVPANTNFATAIAVINAGGHPIFYDGGLMLDLEDLRGTLNERTAAIIVVHIGGHVSPALPAVLELASERDIPLIEDAAHAHGSRLGGKLAGTFGAFAAFSFYQSKVMTTGEGGALVTRDAVAADAARSYRVQGLDHSGIDHIRHGNAWRMTEMSAALGSIMLRSLEADGAHRRQVISRYRALLAGHPSIQFPESASGDGPSGYKVIASLSSPRLREPLKRALAARGVELDREVYARPLHVQPIFAQYRRRALPVAEDFAARHLCLPIWRDIDFDDVDRAGAIVLDELDRLDASQAIRPESPPAGSAQATS
jgi:dTDP-4-amino-4,6-dideoxygalactose transaminase